MESIKIEGAVRPLVGKKINKALRRADRVPCVIYGREINVNFSAERVAFRHLVYTPEFKLAEISVDGKSYKCILKDVQFHPVSDVILHADFIHLADGIPVKANIPVAFQGVSVGEKLGGSLNPQLRKVNIKTTPENLVGKMTVDISHLELGHSVKVKDLIPVKGVKVTNDPNIPVATVEVPRALKSAIDGEEEEVEVGEEVV